MESYYRDGKDHGKAMLIMVRGCLMVNQICSKKVSQQKRTRISLPSPGISTLAKISNKLVMSSTPKYPGFF